MKLPAVNWLDAVIVAACLLACQAALEDHYVSLPLVYLALLAFTLSVFGRFDTPTAGLRAACTRVFLRWGVIVAALLFLFYALDLGDVFDRKLLLTWVAVAPIALCASRAARLRARR